MARRVRDDFLIGIIMVFGHVSVIGASPPDTPAELAQPTLESIMEQLAASGGVKAHFHESRRLAILNEPIESAGMLYFAPPDWLVRHTSEPGESKVVVRDNRVTFRDETGVQILSLDSSEIARALVGNTRVLLRGDIDSLRAQYEVTFGVAGDLWTLDLSPRDRVVRKFMKRLRVQGRGGKLIRMESTETGGDTTLTTFSQVLVGVEFSPEERAEIFSIDAPLRRTKTSGKTDAPP